MHGPENFVLLMSVDQLASGIGSAAWGLPRNGRAAER